MAAEKPQEPPIKIEGTGKEAKLQLNMEGMPKDQQERLFTINKVTKKVDTMEMMRKIEEKIKDHTQKIAAEFTSEPSLRGIYNGKVDDLQLYEQNNARLALAQLANRDNARLIKLDADLKALGLGQEEKTADQLRDEALKDMDKALVDAVQVTKSMILKRFGYAGKYIHEDAPVSKPAPAPTPTLPPTPAPDVAKQDKSNDGAKVAVVTKPGSSGKRESNDGMLDYH